MPLNGTEIQTSGHMARRFFYRSDEATVGAISSDWTHGQKFYPDRVIIWSEDGTVDGSSMPEPGFNDLIVWRRSRARGGGFLEDGARRTVALIEAKEDMSLQQGDGFTWRSHGQKRRWTN